MDRVSFLPSSWWGKKETLNTSVIGTKHSQSLNFPPFGYFITKKYILISAEIRNSLSLLGLNPAGLPALFHFLKSALQYRVPLKAKCCGVCVNRKQQVCRVLAAARIKTTVNRVLYPLWRPCWEGFTKYVTNRLLVPLPDHSSRDVPLLGQALIDAVSLQMMRSSDVHRSTSSDVTV